MSLNNYKNSDQFLGINRPRIKFWGQPWKGGKIYNSSNNILHRICITQAVLEPNSELPENADKFVKVIFCKETVDHLLCVLKHGSIYQAHLNYIFEKGDNLTFRIDGIGNVFLNGYEICETDDSVPSGSVQISPKKIKRRPREFHETTYHGKMEALLDQEEDKSGDNSKTGHLESKAKKTSKKDTPSKEFWNALLNNTNTDSNTPVEDNDEDFYNADEDDDDDDEDYDFEDDENSADNEDEEEEEETSNLNEIRKRKQTQQLSHSQKRLKSAKHSGASDGAMCIDDTKEPPESDSSDSSIAIVPLMKTPEVESKSAQKKKARKKKKKSDISNISQKSNQASTTPLSEEKRKPKKLKGNVEIMDVRVGSGPVAKIGKILHVYYIGRLGDSSVFDSRSRGQKPFSFKLGANQVIKGWDIGLEGMRVGGKRKIQIPPSMGYGNSDQEGIPANSTLYFVVELQAVS